MSGNWRRYSDGAIASMLGRTPYAVRQYRLRWGWRREAHVGGPTNYREVQRTLDRLLAADLSVTFCAETVGTGTMARVHHVVKATYRDAGRTVTLPPKIVASLRAFPDVGADLLADLRTIKSEDHRTLP